METSIAFPQEQHQRAAEHLVHEWARAIDEDRIEAVCELLAPDGRYTIQSRFNADRGLPHALVDARSAAQLRDRIKSLRLANIYEPHHYRHMISGIQVVGHDGARLHVRSNFIVVRTMALDGDMKVFAAGQCADVIDTAGPVPVFASRLFKLDSRLIETLLAIPL